MLTSSHLDLLKSVSRSFYLSIRFLPPAMREPVALGYLLARLTDTIADAAALERQNRIDCLGAVRQVILNPEERHADSLPDLSAAISHEGERELLWRHAELFEWYRETDEKNRSHLYEVILTIIQGQSWDITYFKEGEWTATETGDDLLRYTYWVAGCVGEFWTKVGFTTLGEKFASPDDASSMLVQGRKLGQGLQLINILRDLHEDLPNHRCYLPADELREAGWDGVSLPSIEELAPVFETWLGQCESFLDLTDPYSRKIVNQRAAFCTRLPMSLAQKTAKALRSAGVERVVTEKIKIPRSEVWKSMLKVWLC